MPPSSGWSELSSGLMFSDAEETGRATPRGPRRPAEAGTTRSLVSWTAATIGDQRASLSAGPSARKVAIASLMRR